MQCRRPRFNPWIGKIPWRREWLPTPVFLSGEFHGQRNLVGSIGSQRVRHDWATNTLAHIQFSAVAQSCLILCAPWTSAHQLPCPSPTPRVHPNACPFCQWYHSITSSSVVPFSSHPQSFPASGSFPMSQFFASGGQGIDWSFSFNISLSNEHPELISFRMDWLDLCAVQGTLKSLLQQHSSKASILQCSAFFTVQLSHPYMTTGKPWPWLHGPLLAK